MPWDALNVGNHELQENVNVDYITKTGGFVDHWGGKYLASNVLLTATDDHMGSPFTYLQGKNSTVLTFGFLYNFQNHCNHTVVNMVEETVQEDWFIEVIMKGGYDAILVLAHMDVKDPLVYTILNATRDIVGDGMPIQFITGHTHYRANERLDTRASSFMAGRYLDTLGFVSFPKQSSTPKDNSSDFEHVFLNPNVETLQSTLGVEDMSTSSGLALSSLIHDTRQQMGL